jgi:hypothetical protein
MTTYIIGYDLHPTKDEKYENLIGAIKAYRTWWHHLDSTWVIVSDKSAAETRDDLKRHMYKDDQLLVVQSGNIGSWYGFDDNGNNWLRKNL